MRQDAVVINSVRELLKTRYINCLWCVGTVVGTVPTIPNFDTSSGKKLLSVGNPLMLAQFGFKSFREFASVNLFQVKNRVALSEEMPSSLFRLLRLLRLITAPVDN